MKREAPLENGYPDPLSLESLEATGSASASLVCCQCGATQTPQWREGPQGPKTLCNACGVKWYRQAKRSRKGGGHAGARVLHQRQQQAHTTKSNRVVGDSGDELTVTYCVMSDISEDSEEQLAALNLLSFAGVHPKDLDSADGEALDPDPEPQPTLLFNAEAFVPVSTSLTLTAAATTNALGFISAQLPGPELSCLQQMQAAVQQAFREVQAADAATLAVAQVHR